MATSRATTARTTMGACGVSEWNPIVDMGLDQSLVIGLEHFLGSGLENDGIGNMVENTGALHSKGPPAPDVSDVHSGGGTTGPTIGGQKPEGGEAI